MKLILRSTFLLLFALSGLQLFAQPANDDCGAALPVLVGADEASAVRVAGDTRGGTPSSATTGSPTSVCSGSWFGDDIWYIVTVGEDIPEGSEFVFKAYFDQAANPTDVPAVGMAIYTSCDGDATPLDCFSTDDPTVNTLSLPGGECVSAGTNLLVRVWSGGSPTDFSGTLEVAAYVEGVDDSRKDNVLWEEQFASDPFARGWITEGVCAIAPDSSVNAVFEWLPDGSIMASSFTSATTIASGSFCNGAIGVNSDFNDNGGDPGNIGGGSVPTALNSTGSQSNPATYDLISPAIYTGDFGVPGISLKFTQSLRQLNSSFNVAYRNKDAGDADWTDWEVNAFNTDVAANTQTLSGDVQRFFLPNGLSKDSIQLRIRYIAHYYYFIVDDIRLIETEANNLRVQSNFFAVAPWREIPASEVFPYVALADIYNAGSVAQSNVTLNHTVIQDATSAEVYNQNLAYGVIDPDSLAENKANPVLVTIPNETGTYTGTYTLSSDSTDFEPGDNSISYNFGVSSVTYAYENGVTGGLRVADGAYEGDATPLSFAYGNFFYLPNGSDFRLNSIVFGISNPDTLQKYGKTVDLTFWEWNDNNGDQISQFDERVLLGLGTQTFDIVQGGSATYEIELENFVGAPDDPILLSDGGQYLAMVEYSPGDRTAMFMGTNDDIDYGAAAFAMDSAFQKGWVDHRSYVSALGHSPDGNIFGVDFEVTELDVNDARIFFGNDQVPVVRMILGSAVGVNDPLPESNLISVFPNPTTEMLNIDLEFEKNYDRVTMQVLDMKGQMILSSVLNNVQNQIERLDVRSLPAGSYLLQVVTEDGQRAQPFVVQR